MLRDKDARYDRQVRLWQSGGQAQLEKSHVCVVNANTTSAEILKNLVLPGIGDFTIIDTKQVTVSDLSGNFFLAEDDIGSSISSAMCKNLCELNSDVKGHSVIKDLGELIKDKRFWLQFDVVVVSDFVHSETLASLEMILWPANIPLLRVWTCGFYGALRISRYETAVFETHDPSPTYDLRLDSPWHELEEYSASFNLDELDDAEHAHVPYIVIYLKALKRWRVANGRLKTSALPLTYTEKTDFRKNYVETMARNMGLETNFIEASQSIYRALQATNIPSSIMALFERKEISDTLLIHSKSSFWLYVRALKQFIAENDGFLPLPGVLPDMVSTTSNYVRLHQLYREKALQDQHRFTTIVNELNQLFNLNVPSDKESISSVCKNAAHLHVANGASLFEHKSILKELFKATDGLQDLRSLLAVYFGILALEKTMEGQLTKIPDGSEGLNGNELSNELLRKFKEITNMPEENITPQIHKSLEEILVHHTSGYLNVCSYMGGIVGQEILKIVTAQYIPLDNLYIFDGIRSVSEKFKAL